jgi:DNA-binding beta-propeller fold protein YncE
MKTFKKTGKIKTDPDTDAVVYDPASKLIFTFNGDSKNSSVIDPAKEAVVKTLDLGGSPEQAAADGRVTLYENNADTSEVVVIDTSALTIKARWKVAPAGEPVAMALDPEHRRLFSAGRGPAMLVMMDADNGKVLQSFPISDGADSNVFDSSSGMVFTSTRAGKLHIFHEESADKLSQVETIDTEYGAKTMAMDPKTHNIFLSTSDFGPAAGPKGRRPAIPGTAHLLVYGH